MINFFRTIRRQLLKHKNTNQYLLYAVGEIFLIVIGILIALQLNEWKENQRNKQTEIKLLREIQNDLSDAEANFTSSIEFDKTVLQSKQVIIDVIDRDLPWNDTLQQHFNLFNFWNSYTINSTAYNSLENWGINNISSDPLRRQIINIFQRFSTNLKEMEMDERAIRLGPYNDLLSTRLDWSDIHTIRPLNYQEFLDMEELSTRLKAFKTFTTLSLNNRKAILENIKKVRKNLNDEIERLEN